MILILANTLYMKKDMKKKAKEKNKILLNDLNSIDDINTREYSRFEQERIVRKRQKNNNNNHLRLHKICLDNILEIFEVLDQIYLTISVVEIFKFAQ